jgi:hypothetical protein
MLASATSIVGLAVAALIGLAAGWLLARRARERAVAAAREVATAGTFQLADELYARTKRATELESKLGALTRRRARPGLSPGPCASGWPAARACGASR